MRRRVYCRERNCNLWQSLYAHLSTVKRFHLVIQYQLPKHVYIYMYKCTVIRYILVSHGCVSRKPIICCWHFRIYANKTTPKFSNYPSLWPYSQKSLVVRISINMQNLRCCYKFTLVQRNHVNVLKFFLIWLGVS